MGDPIERPRVVVIDDDSAFLALIDELLGDAGYRAIGWPTSRDALEKLREQPPSAVIVDLWIEDTAAGWQLLNALRADPHLRYLPVVVCSAATSSLRERAGGLRHEAWRVLPKPFDLDELLGVITGLITPATGTCLGDSGRPSHPSPPVSGAAEARH